MYAEAYMAFSLKSFNAKLIWFRLAAVQKCVSLKKSKKTNSKQGNGCGMEVHHLFLEKKMAQPALEVFGGWLKKSKRILIFRG